MQSYGLRTHIWNNQWKSGLLLLGFPFLLALLAFGLALVFNDDPRGLSFAMRSAIRHFPWYFGVAMIAAGAWFLIAWMANQAIMDMITGAHPVTREQEPELWNLLENLCISRGITMPRLAIIATSERNAFASGLSLHKGSVTVTRGLMNALTPAELRAVLAHELTHIRNGDSRLAIIAMVFAGIISLVIEMLFRGWRPGRSDRRGSGAAIAVGVALILIAYALAFVLRHALSRNREYLADAGAVELTQDADAMISALRRIEGRSAIPEMPGQVRAMFLDDPPGESWLSRLGATHPSIDARVAVLVSQAGGRDPGPLPDLDAEAPPEAPPPWSGEGATPPSPSPWGPGGIPPAPQAPGGAGNPWGAGGPSPVPVPPPAPGQATGPWWQGPAKGGGNQS